MVPLGGAVVPSLQSKLGSRAPPLGDRGVRGKKMWRERGSSNPVNVREKPSKEQEGVLEGGRG